MKIEIKDANKHLASYIIMPEEEAKYILVACHGFRGGKENSGQLFEFAKKLNNIGIGVCAFDFSGCGESLGKFEDITLSRQVSDLKLVVDYLDNKYKLPIILLGRSFGGSTILAAYDTDNIVGYILWSTPVLLKETFSTIFKDDYLKLKNGSSVKINDDGDEFNLNPQLVQDFYNHDFILYLSNIEQKPVLVVHGLNDDVVDPKNAMIIKNYIKDCRLCLIKDADHRFANKEEEREEITLKWLKEKLNAIR
ncbi:hypothetical protein SYNTR_0647 [Candidatus Syntrophocurvum alkaliphilum]|uniref:Serine aminopeptidase S33 domain-containing protein n=1 Tax=Candidatus Syntrophocurvum alkaliphilum TaxID=2293317 RepID=A0A6I6DDX4_9FIRM|nr:alpha/beta hydrolase [Candidatus Syntrophocurvum alkaliphilum]QGT99240.1 hypothetical protein SYNTR_0647 [Candidatus Syntrophocurvum alkaliphilum]